MGGRSGRSRLIMLNERSAVWSALPTAVYFSLFCLCLFFLLCRLFFFAFGWVPPPLIPRVVRYLQSCSLSVSPPSPLRRCLSVLQPGGRCGGLLISLLWGQPGAHPHTTSLCFRATASGGARLGGPAVPVAHPLRCSPATATRRHILSRGCPRPGGSVSTAIVEPWLLWRAMPAAPGGIPS